MHSQRFEALMSSVLPEDWRSTIVGGVTGRDGVILSEHFKAQIPQLLPGGWMADGQPLPMFHFFTYQMIPHVMSTVWLAKVTPSMVFLSTDVSFGNMISAMCCLMVWNPMRDRLFFCGLDNPPIAQYVDISQPIWEAQL